MPPTTKRPTARPFARLLRLLTSVPLADSILGDLEEERRRHRSRLGGWIWFWRQAIAIGVYAAARLFARVASDIPKGGDAVRGVSRDALYAARSLRRAPWYVAAVVTVMGVAVTLATTAFAVVDGMLFQSLPYDHPRELYAVEGAFSEYPAAIPPPASARNARKWAEAAPKTTFTLIGSNSTELKT